MTIRNRLLLMFGGFAVLPLLGIGAFDYFRSMRGVEALLARQTGVIIARAEVDLRARFAVQESDLTLLSDNADTQRWLQRIAAGAADNAKARSAAEAFLRDAWQFFRGSYPAIRLRPADGGPGILLGDDGSADPDLTQRRLILDSSHEVLGSLEFVTPIAEALRTSAFATPFGDEGANLVYDRERDAMIFRSLQGSASEVAAFLVMLRAHRDVFRGPDGSFRYRERGRERLASFASFESPPWTIVVTASLEEFGGPLLRTRVWDLALLVGIVFAISFGVIVLLRRMTAPLTALTTAADHVARGDLTPTLPEVSRDEVGRLSAAFGIMVRRIAEMMRQVEASRQMAVLGEFAAQLSHEIRNPLTAVKINLQGLERDVRAGRLSPDATPSLTIALREVQRLDTVVHGVLRMARAPADPAPYALHPLLSEVMQLLSAQATRQDVHVTTSFDASNDQLCGDEEAMRGAVLNLLLNALEAQPTGGSIHISTRMTQHEDSASIEVLIRDAGPGLTAEQTARIFQPFFTTKPNGTGLGLPLALRAIRAHGGVMAIAPSPGSGVAVRIVLPSALNAVTV